jgi:hypothetical protein
MSDSLRVVSLTAENVKRLTAVHITPDGNMVVIGGANEQGKSTVIDSVAYALGGTELLPPEPIRQGESTAEIRVDLGEFLVIRKFKRDRIITCDCDQPNKADIDLHAVDCSYRTQPPVFGPTRTSLVIKSNKDDGAVFTSPQTMLDKLIGKLSFDPLAFASEMPRNQRKTLAELLNLDTESIDAEKAGALNRKAALKKRIVIAEGKLRSLPVHINTPNEEISIAEISQGIAEAERLRAIADDAQKTAGAAARLLESTKAEQSATAEKIARLETELADARGALVLLDGSAATLAADTESANETATAARAAVPDASALQARLEEAEAMNTRVRANEAHKAARAAFVELEAEAEAEGKTAADLDAKKLALLAGAKYPVDGLGLNDDGVTFNGLPFEQASKSQQIRVSVAIGLALNPKLRVLLIRDGSLLDSKNLRLLAEQSAEANTQVWIERVTESKDGVSVMIEDGHVVE